MTDCRHAARLAAALRDGVPAVAPPEHGSCAACDRVLRRRDAFERGLTGAAEGLATALPTTTLHAARTIRRRPLTFPALAKASAPAIAVVVLAIAVGAGIGALAERDRGLSGSPTVDQTNDPTQAPSPLPSLVGAPDGALPPPDAAALRELAERYMLDDPPQDAEFVRYISPEEYAAVMVPCLTEQGIPVRALPDGGVGYDDLPEEEWVRQREAGYRCHVRFPTHPMFEEPLSDDQLRRLYSYLVDDLTPCLEDEGYATTAPPAVEVFIETYPVGNAWSPWPANDPRLHAEEEWYRLNVACPQSPSIEYLYGDALSP